MSKRVHLSNSEIEAVLGIIRSVAQAPGRAAQRSLLIDQCVGRFDAKMGVLFTIELGLAENIDVQVAAVGGHLNRKEQLLFQMDALHHQYRRSPSFQALAVRAAGLRVPLATFRGDLTSDRQWYGSPYVNEVLHPAYVDDQLIALSPLEKPNLWAALILVRGWREHPRFNARDRDALSMIHRALSFLSVPDPFTPPIDLPPRLRELIDLLMRGLSEKEIAAELELSPFTVHRHVGRLYRRLEVSSRAELMARMGPQFLK